MKTDEFSKRGKSRRKPVNPPKQYLCENGVRFEITSNGLIFCPEEGKGGKKHDCPDCKFCQWCSRSRCSLCLNQGRP